VGEWRYSSTTLDLGTRWRWLVRFTSRPLYHPYPLERRLGELQSQSWRCGEETNYLPCWESNLGRPAHCYTNWAIPAVCIVAIVVNSIVSGQTLIKIFGALDGTLFTTEDVQVTKRNSYFPFSYDQPAVNSSKKQVFSFPLKIRMAALLLAGTCSTGIVSVAHL
jgi:hypothetical protein